MVAVVGMKLLHAAVEMLALGLSCGQDICTLAIPRLRSSKAPHQRKTTSIPFPLDVINTLKDQ